MGITLAADGSAAVRDPTALRAGLAFTAYAWEAFASGVGDTEFGACTPLAQRSTRGGGRILTFEGRLAAARK